MHTQTRTRCAPSEVLARGVEESQVVLTQAKKFRSDIEKARVFYRKPGGVQPSERINMLNQHLLVGAAPNTSARTQHYYRDQAPFSKNIGRRPL